jgi:hypothetical protein
VGDPKLAVGQTEGSEIKSTSEGNRDGISIVAILDGEDVGMREGLLDG